MKASAAGTKASTQEEENSDGDEYVIDAWSHTTLSLTAFGRAGAGTALKTTHGEGQTACRFTNCAPFSESAKGESPKRSSILSRKTSGMPQGTNVSSPWKPLPFLGVLREPVEVLN